MLIAVLATDEQWNELLKGCDETLLVRVHSVNDDVMADAYIVLDETVNDSLQDIHKPVLLNAVVNTLREMGAAQNIFRINGWTGFLQRKTWEVAGAVTEELKQILATAGKQLIEVADEPGLVAARSISVIINEAYFALGEEVSTKEEIDTAMKLGTNYPSGPFEWADKIGLEKIYELLMTLVKSGQRYTPAPLLVKEATA